MATPAQVLANQANAQLSTGPRSPQGKLASSQNGTTTGLTSPNLFVRPDEQQAFSEFNKALTQELQPKGTTQEHHFALILHAAWNLRRCLDLESKLEAEAFAQNVEILDDPELTRRLDRIYRYKKMHEAAHRRNTAELRKLQTEQLWRRDREGLEEESILVDITGVEIKLTKRQAAIEQGNLSILRQGIETLINPVQLRQ